MRSGSSTGKAGRYGAGGHMGPPHFYHLDRVDGQSGPSYLWSGPVKGPPGERGTWPVREIGANLRPQGRAGAGNALAGRRSSPGTSGKRNKHVSNAATAVHMPFMTVS